MYLKLDPEQKKIVLDRIKSHFEMERGEEIGEIAAENFFEFIKEDIGSLFYNEGLKAAREVVDERVMNLDEDIRSLERPIK
ncbi:DUF2164 domain-containing protein [Aquisalibacillus elongatus]|uniref:Uncharacterized protein (DUF2164 family) n=1 Tax=Aquisalibacillus elongatus TaxID=485577 RepID=A0A3N5B8X8_9BACI|nr:DUF2164 domain-containing protein [Aquisalibacillus elongatus]RPF53439.1 uncharacterized protein (DUF2164 family) [Aquisalibacillus elongatus]